MPHNNFLQTKAIAIMIAGSVLVSGSLFTSLASAETSQGGTAKATTISQQKDLLRSQITLRIGKWQRMKEAALVLLATDRAAQVTVDVAVSDAVAKVELLKGKIDTLKTVAEVKAVRKELQQTVRGQKATIDDAIDAIHLAQAKLHLEKVASRVAIIEARVAAAEEQKKEIGGLRLSLADVKNHLASAAQAWEKKDVDGVVINIKEAQRIMSEIMGVLMAIK